MIRFIIILTLVAFQVLAGNGPNPKQEWEYYGKKVNFQCGTNFQLDWDVESMKKHILVIKHDQYDGRRECNEPMRLLYYACKDDNLKQKLQTKKIKKIKCAGSDKKVGSLKFSSGSIYVELANDENNFYKRAFVDFQEAFNIEMTALKVADPYQDSEWNDLRWEKNPVTDFRNYCIVNGEKFELDVESPRAYIHYDPIIRRKESGAIKCFRHGKVYVDLTIEKGEETGFVTKNSSPPYFEENYLKGKKHGLTHHYDREGKLKSITHFIQNKKEWSKEFYSDGKLKEYDRNFNPLGYKYETARVRYFENEKISLIQCHPKAGDDSAFEKICGFKGKSKVKVYSNQGKKVQKEIVFLNGEEQKKVEKLADGKTKITTHKKKDGKEIVKKANGDILYSKSWKNGNLHGESQFFHEKENKLIKLMNYKDGTLLETTEYFLNGNKKSYIKHPKFNHRHMTEYYDLGGVLREGPYIWCQKRWWSYWCENGDFKTYYESGEKLGEQKYEAGLRVGTHTYYHKNGNIYMIETFDKENNLTMLKIFDEKGVLKLHEEYEKDGSRKIIFQKEATV